MSVYITSHNQVESLWLASGTQPGESALLLSPHSFLSFLSNLIQILINNGDATLKKAQRSSIRQIVFKVAMIGLGIERKR